MTGNRSEKWRIWRETVAKQCERLTEDCADDEFVTALNSIARKCLVKRVVFRPLLLDGGLGRDGNGYVMYVKCDPVDVQDYTREFEENGARSLPPRTRFTIAHEICHTFFWHSRGGELKPQLDPKHPIELKRLEQECDFGASRLLLPSWRLKPFIESQFSLNPSFLRSMSEKFRVSLQTLVIRLAHIGNWGNDRGVVALIASRDGQPKIQSIAIDNYSRPLFPNAAKGADIGALVDFSSFTLHGGARTEGECSIRCKYGEQPCWVTCQQMSRKSGTYLVTIRILPRR